ncbi:MAG TPA: flagellar basal-body rod protein FlgF [Terriglobales bacterium]|jgi:flagellar basal-body rod protein FlgF/flagellar basal-body rod protein FlgG
MDSGYYAACAGLLARTQALDLVANNLANVNTTGYRGQEPTFRSLVSSLTGGPMAELNRAVNDFNVIGGSRLDFSAGNLERTGNPLDLALEGSGFFAVDTPAGVRYTRNGNFQLSPQGVLVTAQGDSVLGQQGKITVPAGPVSVSADGTLSSRGVVFGKLRVVDFPSSAGLFPIGQSYYAAEGTSAHAATDANVRQGMLESSNVSPVTGMMNLIAVQRHAEMLQRAMSMFHSELNRIAANDLAKI